MSWVLTIARPQHLTGLPSTTSGTPQAYRFAGHPGLRFPVGYTVNGVLFDPVDIQLNIQLDIQMDIQISSGAKAFAVHIEQNNFVLPASKTHLPARSSEIHYTLYIIQF